MKKISSKQAKINREYHKVCNEIAQERDHKCSGCGRYVFYLSHSHLIPRSRRPDLVACKENIVYHCLDWNGKIGCHNQWEHHRGIGLLDYDANMAIIKELDPGYYEIRLDV